LRRQRQEDRGDHRELLHRVVLTDADLVLLERDDGHVGLQHDGQ
jgi:hypothetical protein